MVVRAVEACGVNGRVGKVIDWAVQGGVDGVIGRMYVRVLDVGCRVAGNMRDGGGVSDSDGVSLSIVIYSSYV